MPVTLLHLPYDLPPTHFISSPITSLTLHPASFPYSLVGAECPAVGWSIPKGPGQFPIMKFDRKYRAPKKEK